ncbi:hypothetical protein WD019_18875 [Fictibacillus sp. Mic-4]|uniref:hypothetical protein n=1 Tax=Fictibacillus sp. Mic-4 TaxID=3132826 RepID=UPI003CF6E908
MGKKLMVILMFALVISLVSPFSMKTAEASRKSPKIGNVETLSYKMSASIIKREIHSSKVTKAAAKKLSTNLASGVSVYAKNVLHGGFISISTKTLSTIIGLRSESQIQKLKGYLSLIKKKKVKGIKIKVKYRYSKMAGSKGWFPSGKAVLSTY